MPYPNAPGTWSSGYPNQYRYPPQQYPAYPQNSPQQRQQVNFLWVNGIAGAKAYPTMPNSDVLLLDNNDPYLYLKSTDSANFPTVERFKIIKDPIAEHVEPEQQTQQYATREEVASLSEKLDNAVALLESMSNKEYRIDIATGGQNAKPDIQQPATTSSEREPDHGPHGSFEGGYERGYEGDFRSNAR